MENKKGMMKTFLCENLRELMCRNLFEKITIKNICDETGVIRATFYNYFDDKYDCLNYIVYKDIVEGVDNAVEASNVIQVYESILNTVDENRTFYRNAYNVTGQNSFEDMIRANLAILFKQFFEKYRKPGYLEQYDNDLLSNYYAECVAFDIRLFVLHNGVQKRSAHEMALMISDLMRNSVVDFMNSNTIS